MYSVKEATATLAVWLVALPLKSNHAGCPPVAAGARACPGLVRGSCGWGWTVGEDQEALELKQERDFLNEEVMPARQALRICDVFTEYPGTGAETSLSASRSVSGAGRSKVRWAATESHADDCGNKGT